MNFNNKYITYNQNALVQKELANDLLSLLKIVDIHLGLQRFISVSAYPKMLLFLKAGYLETEPSCVTRLSISTIFEIT